MFLLWITSLIFSFASKRIPHPNLMRSCPGIGWLFKGTFQEKLKEAAAVSEKDVVIEEVTVTEKDGMDEETMDTS